MEPRQIPDISEVIPAEILEKLSQNSLALVGAEIVAGISRALSKHNDQIGKKVGGSNDIRVEEVSETYSDPSVFEEASREELLRLYAALIDRIEFTSEGVKVYTIWDIPD